MRRTRLQLSTLFTSCHLVVSFTLALSAALVCGTCFVLSLILLLSADSRELSGGMSGLIAPVVLSVSLLGCIAAVVYGAFAVFSWWQARNGLPIVAILVAAFNTLALSWATLMDIGRHSSLAVTSAFVASVVLSAGIFVGLGLARAPIRPSTRSRRGH